MAKEQACHDEYAGKDGWKEKEEALVGGFYSNSLNAWDYDRDGKLDLLTGSHYEGALTLLWKNMGNGKFLDMARFVDVTRDAGTPVEKPEATRDPVQDVEAALKALRGAHDKGAKARALDALEKATKKLKDHYK